MTTCDDSAPCAPLRRRFNRLPAPSIIDDLRIERGTLDDYRSLARFHYKSGRPGAAMAVFRMVRRAATTVGRYLQRGEEAQVVGVLVRSLPALSCQLRNLATNDRYRSLRPRDAAVMLNREVRTISRVVVDPQWRGLGLAVKLVRHALAHPHDGFADGAIAHENSSEIRFAEALAAMGRVSPFFEHAGMTRYDRPPRVEQARLIDAMQRLGLQPFALASIATVRQRLTEAGDREFLLHELRRWHRAAHRTSTARLATMSLDDLLIAARDELLAQPVYYLFQHTR